VLKRKQAGVFSLHSHEALSASNPKGGDAHDNGRIADGFLSRNCAPGFSCTGYSALPQDGIDVMAPSRTGHARIDLSWTGSAVRLDRCEPGKRENLAGGRRIRSDKRFGERFSNEEGDLDVSFVRCNCIPGFDSA